MSYSSRALVLVATVCGAALPLPAQQVETRLSLGAGSATDALGTRSSAVTVSPSLVVRPDARVALALGGDAVRFAAGGWALGGSAGLDLRAPLPGGLALTLGAGGSGTTTSFDARFLAAQAVPALEGRWGPVQLYAGPRAAAGSSTLPVQVENGGSGIPGLPGNGGTTTRDVTTTRTLLGSVAGGGVFLGDARRSGYVGVREERGTVRTAGADDALVIDRSVSASLQAGALALAATVGARSAPGEVTGFQNVSGSWSIVPAVALQVAAGRYPSNRLTGTLGGSYLSAGISLAARGHPGAAAPASPERGIPGAAAQAPGTTRLAIRARGARRVELAGDWNTWKPVAVLRAADGWWYADLVLRPGRYRYAFRVDGTRWSVPDGADVVNDGFGGRSALVIVR